MRHQFGLHTDRPECAAQAGETTSVRRISSQRNRGSSRELAQCQWERLLHAPTERFWTWNSAQSICWRGNDSAANVERTLYRLHLKRKLLLIDRRPIPVPIRFWINTNTITTSKECGWCIVVRRKWSSQNDQHEILLNENHRANRTISENDESLRCMRVSVCAHNRLWSLALTEFMFAVFSFQSE